MCFRICETPFTIHCLTNGLSTFAWYKDGVPGMQLLDDQCISSRNAAAG